MPLTFSEFEVRAQCGDYIGQWKAVSTFIGKYILLAQYLSQQRHTARAQQVTSFKFFLILSVETNIVLDMGCAGIDSYVSCRLVVGRVTTPFSVALAIPTLNLFATRSGWL